MLFSSRIFLVALLAAGSAAAQDRFALGSGTAPVGGTIQLPLTIQDRSGTPVGNDQPAGAKLQGISIRVSWSPASAFSAGSFARAGLLAAKSPVFESAPTTPSSASYLAVFSESTAAIPWTGGDDLALQLTLTVGSGLAQGAVVTLVVDPTTTTTAGNQAGTIAETVPAGTLEVANGAVTVCGSALAPVAPGGLSPAAGAAIAGGPTTFSWGAVTNASRYVVRLGASGATPFAAEIAAPATSWQFPISPQGSWTWSVEAIPASGGVAAASSGPKSFTTASGSPRLSAGTAASIARWNGPVAVSFAGAGLDTGTIGFDGAAPGSFAAATTTPTLVSGTFTPDTSAKAGWYAPALLVSASPVAALPHAFALRAFADVAETAFYFESSDRMVAADVIDAFSGPSGPEFRPDQRIDRAEMADALVRANYRKLGLPVPSHTCASYFPDVPCSDPRNPMIELARELGITLGAADGNFYPDSGLTRAEMAAFLDRLSYGGDAAVPKCVPDPGWSDLASIPGWAQPYVNLLRNDRISAGCSATPLTYCALLGMTRGELATFLSRILEEVPKP